MSFRPTVLYVVVALVLPAITLGEQVHDPTVPPIRAVKGVTPKPSVFKTAGRSKPLIIRSEKEAIEHFADAAVATLKKQVDFKQQIVLVFAWRGSGQDRLAYSVAESYPEQVFFTFRPGRTRDLRPHVHVYAVRSNVTWSGPTGRSGPATGGKTTRTAYSDEQIAARKHPRYREIHEAKNVVVATLDQAKMRPEVAMSYPPIYGFDLTLSVHEVLRGSFKPQERVRCSYNKTSVEKPALPVGKRCLVLLRVGPRNTTAYYIEQASEDLLKVARVASAEANRIDEVNAALARDKPDQHPLYEVLKKAEGVVVATGDLEGVASHDSRGVSTESQICVVSMKGELKRGDRFEAVFPAEVAPQGKLPDAKFLIVGYRRVAGKYQVTCVAEASDTNLRVAAAATGTPPRTRKDVEAVELPGAKRAKPSRSRDGRPGRQSGQSRPSGGAEAP